VTEPAGIVVRAAVAHDLGVLWNFLTMAAYEPDASAAKAVPMVASYLDGWQRSEDFGFIAERNAVAIGAAWARRFAADDEWHFHFGDRTAEMSIGVNANERGQGVGQMLIRALIAEADRRLLRLGLNVRHSNPALRLYQRMGFRIVPGMTVTNRVGGLSSGMLLADHGSRDPAATPPAPAARDGA
jgi:ribosomal protein S18 acetylase RimI-like enzyme